MYDEIIELKTLMTLIKKKNRTIKKKYTLGGLNLMQWLFQIWWSLKSVTTSLLYTDVSPKNKYFITLNQWFDESLIDETNLQPIYYPSLIK